MFNELHHGLVVYCMHWIDNNDLAHRRDHILAVAKEAADIAKHYGLDRTRMLLAALLHDIYSGRDRKEHHNLAAEWVRANLGKYGYDEDTVACIARMCAEHRASLRGEYSDIYCEAFSAADRGPLSLIETVERGLGKGLTEISKKELIEQFPMLYEKLMVKFGRQGYARPNNVHATYYADAINKFVEDTVSMENALEVVLCHQDSAIQYRLGTIGDATDMYLLPDGGIYEYNSYYGLFCHQDGHNLPSHEVPVIQGRVQILNGVI